MYAYAINPTQSNPMMGRVRILLCWVRPTTQHYKFISLIHRLPSSLKIACVDAQKVRKKFLLFPFGLSHNESLGT